MSDALKLGLLPRNVVALVDPVEYQTEEFTIGSAAKIADYSAFWYTAPTTGMRPSELVALPWEDVGDGTLRVTHTVSVVANKPVLKSHTKTKHGKRILAQPREVTEGPLVFPSRRDGFLSHRNLRRAPYLRHQSGGAGHPAARHAP
jgi:integrase